MSDRKRGTSRVLLDADWGGYHFDRLYFGAHDRSYWKEGPWDNEPDKAQWVDEATGYDCMVRRGPLGHWCGYVGVPLGHQRLPHAHIRVHGGVTYAATSQLGDEMVPGEGRPAEVFWVGFDCGHAGDAMPEMGAAYRRMAAEARAQGDEEKAQRCEENAESLTALTQGNYRTLGYVISETTSLARQLHDVASTRREEEGGNSR